MKKFVFAALPLLLALTPAVGWSQATDDLDVIELELEQNSKPAATPQASPVEQQDSSKDNTLSDFSGLSGLSPFSDVSVIQKRFMPKTGRFQLFAGGTVVTNNPFFNTLGGSLKGSYFFNETWGIEANYMLLTTSERESTKELRDVNNIATQALSYPKQYIGADVMFVPIYGKLAWFNNRIVPFDLYFSAGYGTTLTKDDQNAGTVHLAAGQIFSLTKSTAFRWDFSWNFYNATTEDKQTNTFNNLFLTVGMSWFFPEASYR